MSEPSQPSSIIRGGRLGVALAAIEFATSRSGGPGGQNVNKLNSRVALRLPLSAITGLDELSMGRLRTLAGRKINDDGILQLISQQTRSQEQNRALALNKLVELLEEASRIPLVRKATKSTRGARRRRLKDKKLRGETKSLRAKVD